MTRPPPNDGKPGNVVRFPVIAEHVFGLAPLRRNARPDPKPIAIDYARIGAGTWRHIGAIARPAGQRIMPGAAQ